MLFNFQGFLDIVLFYFWYCFLVWFLMDRELLRDFSTVSVLWRVLQGWFTSAGGRLAGFLTRSPISCSERVWRGL